MRTELIFRALADPTRLRIMRLLGSMELAVGEVAQVLGQSQPRVSRHIGILCDAGLAERRREGSWVFLRAGANSGEAPPLSRAVAELLVEAEAVDAQFAEECRQDRRKLAEIREHRESEALAYFSDHAEDWDELRRMHSSDEAVEAALARALEARPLGRLLDIGTGTGRMAELFAERAERIVALDKSLAMLRVARAKLQHLPAERVELVQGDFGSLPFAADSFDTVLFHQVLHFAQAPATVLAEAARVTRPDGRVAIVDFAAHQREELRDRHAHARLGFEDSALAGMLDAAGFEPAAPIALEDGELVVKIWIAQRRAAERELAS
ncbi:methyltransferase domain-containing protein [Qipengyuania flava]|jgi:ArsR family transcriptional regulator|uniref:ArsR family transcriptional regulator n=1 Tax=Qipengyuania flava TaxID=192812 RepID=A0A3T1CGD2_9SPHN|nr:metalloregulator ArsR/SmtB family transcription factor [Qipengyuania flava]KZX89200.1 ArsR family transcriptional regulator [Erythrobacter sp. HI0020]KZY12965.1 ArsR family transcriptional regulator [Erythrobacter sp. HI0037]KZY17505.1 ArsR family transcriptional regulator [Erythrobacter sp. HI0038]MEC7623227.1 metalloregulator ArsR/SmtB family transcription factor [Pseudomonadota bacterium]QFI62851.1 methyltransferase domain-containing protein [Qipengyuania flava]